MTQTSNSKSHLSPKNSTSTQNPPLMTVLVSSENTRPSQSLPMRRMGTDHASAATDLLARHLATWGRGQESIHSNGSEKEHDGEGNVKGSCFRETGPAASRTEISSRPLGLRSAGSRLGDNEILVRLAVGLELHLVLVEGEFDAGVDGNQGLVGRLLLADVIVGGEPCGQRIPGRGVPCSFCAYRSWSHSQRKIQK